MQNPIVWQDSLSVGIETIDNQHKSLFQALSDLQKAAQASGERLALQRLFTFLARYTVEHFRDEEVLMRGCNYSRYEAHKAEHDALAKQVLDVQAKYRSGATAALSMEVMNFLKNWLVKHIMGIDKKYTPYLNQRGVK